MQQITTDDIGGRLRRAREQRGLTLRDTANRTKLSISVLQAIERNEFTRLPGGLFRRAYVRMLAAEMGLDANELAREYCARFEPHAPDEPPPPPPRLADFNGRYLKQPLTAGLFAALAVLACAWLVVRPGSFREPAVDGASLEGVVATVPAAGRPERSHQVAFARAVDAETTEPSLRLEMWINRPCWLSAEADGDRVAYRLMAPGERVVVEAQHTIALRIGDAGAVAYSINGVTGRSLGRNGEVADLRITPDNVDSLGAEPATTVSRGGASTHVRPTPARRGAESI